MIQHLYDALQRAKVVGVLRASSAELATQAALAALRGGLRVVELTFTTPNAVAALERVRTLQPQALLGAGSVMSLAQAQEAAQAGADFLVSPHLDTTILRFANEHGVPYVPGVLTPNEIAQALGLGVSLVKIFPIGSSGGAAYLRDLRGPFPQLQAMVTGGIAPQQAADYFAAGALALGLGSQVFPSASLEAADWQAVETATRDALAKAGVV
ncbi:MAG: bifunctional 4-hydroxy-2-oxoglutarate aldolase/2-dehydro-3-deoxy-phosphogluconate aldolase [Deinococcales bacterium]